MRARCSAQRGRRVPTTGEEMTAAQPRPSSGRVARRLAGVAAGRTAVSAGRDGPLLLRCGDELVVLGADGALLTGFDRRRRAVRGEAARSPAEAGPSWVEDDHMQVLALCG